MRNIKLTIAYDGTAYFGWEDNRQHISIESELTRSLMQIQGSAPKLQAASRTDRGVHAKEQTVNFFLEDKTLPLPVLQKALNGTLPIDIRVLFIEEAPLSFHPTLDAKGKIYCYYICTAPFLDPLKRLYYWHVPIDADIDAMRNTASHLIGTHDFKTFCNMRKDLSYESFVRTIESIDIDESDQDCLCITLKGTSFLYKMARNLVGTLMSAGRGEHLDIPSLIASKDRTLIGVTAPACGLFLQKVLYS